MSQSIDTSKTSQAEINLSAALVDDVSASIVNENRAVMAEFESLRAELGTMEAGDPLTRSVMNYYRARHASEGYIIDGGLRLEIAKGRGTADAEASWRLVLNDKGFNIMAYGNHRPAFYGLDDRFLAYFRGITAGEIEDAIREEAQTIVRRAGRDGGTDLPVAVNAVSTSIAEAKRAEVAAFDAFRSDLHALEENDPLTRSVMNHYRVRHASEGYIIDGGLRLEIAKGRGTADAEASWRLVLNDKGFNIMAYGNHRPAFFGLDDRFLAYFKGVTIEDVKAAIQEEASRVSSSGAGALP